MGMIVNPSLFDVTGGMLNLVTDFDDKLFDWNTYQLANQASHSLFIPAGTHDALFGAGASFGQLSKYGPGVQLIIGASVETTFVDNLGRPFSKNPYVTPLNNFENGPLPKIDTILPGEDVATLKDLDDLEQFSVGQWVQLLAYDMQGYGYPQNNHYCEYRQIVDIDEGTGEITLDQGVRGYYKDTYPAVSGGSILQPDHCGAATLMPMNELDWNYHARAQNLTLNPTFTGPMYSEGREITWENCHFIHYGHIPSLTRIINYINCTFGGFAGFEIDKCVDEVNFTDCICDDIMGTQSSSVYQLNMTNCHTTDALTGGISGTPVHATFTDCTFPFMSIGTSAYGSSRTLTLDNVNITDAFAATFKSFSFGDQVPEITNHGGGVFSLPLSTAGAVGFDLFIRLVPDPNVWYHFTHPSFGKCGPGFQCTDVTYNSGTGILTYTTTLTGSEGMLAISDTAVAVAIPSMTVTNTTEGKAAPFSYAAAAGLPSCSYYNSGPWPAGAAFYLAGGGEPRISGTNYPLGNYPLSGEIVSFIFTVTKPYTGVASDCIVALWGEFFNGFNCTDADFVNVFWDPYFNLKVAGTRVMTPSGVTGAAPGESLALGSAVWMKGFGNFNVPRLNVDISGEDSSVWPEYTWEIILDQGTAYG